MNNDLTPFVTMNAPDMKCQLPTWPVVHTRLDPETSKLGLQEYLPPYYHIPCLTSYHYRYGTV
jgi:hypothetical protein